MNAKYKAQITYLDANTTNQPGATNTTNADGTVPRALQSQS